MLTVDNIIYYAITRDLGKLPAILYTWRKRSSISSIVERKKIDFACKYTLRYLERAYPGRVWPELTQLESELIDQMP